MGGGLLDMILTCRFVLLRHFTFFFMCKTTEDARQDQKMQSLFVSFIWYKEHFFISEAKLGCDLWGYCHFVQWTMPNAKHSKTLGFDCQIHRRALVNNVSWNIWTKIVHETKEENFNIQAAHFWLWKLRESTWKYLSIKIRSDITTGALYSWNRLTNSRKEMNEHMKLFDRIRWTH